MMKSLYYVGFCIVVLNAGAIITQLIFNCEFSWSMIDGNIGFLMLGIFEMLYSKQKTYNKTLEALKDDFFVTILAIDNVCDKECSRKIREEAGRLNVFLHLNPTKFFEELDKKDREKANKGGK